MPAAAKWLLVILVAALPVALSLSGAFSPETIADRPASQAEVIRFSKELVKTFIRTPEKAVFPADDAITVEPLAQHRWRVSGYVDTQSGIKTPVRLPWTIEVEQQGTRWALVKREPELNEYTKAVRDRSWTSGMQGKKGADRAP